MTSLEWTGYLPAVVSAVHALGVVLRLCWERVPGGGGPGGSRTAGGRGGLEKRHAKWREKCRCDGGPLVVRVGVATPPPVSVPLQVVVTVEVVPGGGMAGEEWGPW